MFAGSRAETFCGSSRCDEEAGPILPNNQPKRIGRRRIRAIWLTAGCFLLTLCLALAFLNRQTLYFLINPEQIRVKTAEEIFSALNGNLTYRALDDAVHVGVTLAEDGLERLEARFNAYNIRINSIPAAARLAQDELSPYLTPPEIKALGILMTAGLSNAVSADTVEYALPIGGHVIGVTGNLGTGDMLVVVSRSRS
jgi:hypothetical protein